MVPMFNATNMYGLTPVHSAIFKKNTELVTFIDSKLAVIDNQLVAKVAAVNRMRDFCKSLLNGK